MAIPHAPMPCGPAHAQGHRLPIRQVVFSPDGKQLASASVDGTVKLWDTTTGQEEHTLHGHAAGVEGVAFSPDGKRLASASNDQTVKVWDLAEGRATGVSPPVLTLIGH